jgi:hypothetical protein
MERQRLTLEVQRAQARQAEIVRRVQEIDAKAIRLHLFVEKRMDGIGLPSQLPALPPAQPLTIHQPIPEKMKRRALQY